MNDANKIEMYHVGKTYLEGWYTLKDLERILETAQRIDFVNKQLELNFTESKTSG